MSLITGKLKDLLKIKPKTRFDGYTDQFHRIFMVKMSMVSYTHFISISSLKFDLEYFSKSVSNIYNKYPYLAMMLVVLGVYSAPWYELVEGPYVMYYTGTSWN